MVGLRLRKKLDEASFTSECHEVYLLGFADARPCLAAPSRNPRRSS